MDIALIEYMNEQLRLTTSTFHRYLYKEIPWEDRMKGIVGPRGVGKSTMLLQYIQEHREEQYMLYVSADNFYFSTHTLTGLADEFVKDGGQHLFIDEIHKYEHWPRELKQIYDTHPDLRVTFTGSSVLDIIQGQADLSRRVLIYTLQGLSFREFLGLFKGIDIPAYTLEDILGGKANMPDVRHPLPLFREYLQHGYYPFSGEADYMTRLRQIISLTMEVDIPTYANMNASTGRKLKQLLAIVAKSVPFKPVMQNLAVTLGVSRNNISDYLMYIEKAQMIGQLRDNVGGIRGWGKVEKVYLDNTNLIYALAGDASNVGNLRETFFYNQMRVRNEVIASRISDFEIGGRTFEVGGKTKGKKQIQEAAEGYVVRDDIEYAAGNVIPLWAFGLNY